MSKPTKIVVHWDDGSKYEIPADKVTSIFMKQSAAVKCGHKPPYGPPPKKNVEMGEMVAAVSTADAGGGGSDTTEVVAVTGGGCYLINGVIVCP